MKDPHGRDEIPPTSVTDGGPVDRLERRFRIEGEVGEALKRVVSLFREKNFRDDSCAER